jgi:hypothetical protein
MLQFSVPVRKTGQFFHFKVSSGAVLFAASRYGTLPLQACRLLVEAFGRLGASFTVGCAPGIDRAFRHALSQSPYKENVFVACVFPSRLNHSYGLFAAVVVPRGISPKAALARRTLWMVKRCSMAVLFPDNPHTGRWGKGSRLVFHNTL